MKIPFINLDARFQHQWLNAEPPILNVGCESDPALLRAVPGTVNVDIDDWSALGSSFRQMDACVAPWPFADASFDTVVFGDSLDHMEHPDVALAEARRVARRAIVFSLPKDAPTPEGDAFTSHVEDLKKIGLQACAAGDLHRRHAHFTHWTRDKVLELLRGFDEEQIDLGSVPSGPPTDRHWYWAGVIRLDADRWTARMDLDHILPRVSILCCTYRPGGLDVLFDGLARQDYAGERELVLVDELYSARQSAVECAWMEAHDRAGVLFGVIRHVSNSRSLHPRDSTARAHNEAIINATGDIAIWLTDYASVPANFISAHVAEHIAYEYETSSRRLVVNGAFVNVWPPRLDATIRVHPISIFESTPSREFIEALPLTNRLIDPATGSWTRLSPNLSQDEATLRMPEGWAGPSYYFMKNDSVRLDVLREIGGNDESFDGLHKFHDTEMGLRLAAIGCRFVHSKRAIARVLQVRHLMKRLGAPPEADAEARGLALLHDTQKRIEAGIVTPRETHPELRR